MIPFGGISKPYGGLVRGETLNSQDYFQNSLTKLIDFMHEHHNGIYELQEKE